MDDLSEKLTELLADEESMKQIKELAELLSGASSDSDNSNNNSESSADTDKQSGIDISQLLGAFSGSTENNGSSPGGIDLNMIMSLMGLMQGGTEDKNRDFLLALRPLLSTDKQAKLDKAVKLLRIYGIYNTLKQSGMLNDLDKLL